MSNSLATKQVATILVAVALVFGFTFAFATPAKADVLSDLQAQVQALLAQIATLQGGSTSGGSMSSGCYTFTQNLKAGQSGGEVKWVQQFLNGHGFQVSASGAGSPGNETSTFGPATKAAVIKFQNANAATILTPVGLSAGTGYWGPSSRAAANSMCAGTSTGTGTSVPVSGAVSVMGGSQPANSLAPQGASRVPFTNFTLTNGTNQSVTVTGVVVQRTGLASNSVFSSVVLVNTDSSTQIGTSKTINSNDQATVGDSITLSPGQSIHLQVAGNMASSLSAYSGQVVSLSVVGVNTSVPVSGSLPISGAQQTVNSTLSVGSVSTSTSAFDPGAAQTKNIGDTAVRFAGVRFTAGSTEDLKLYSVRWRQVGTGSSADISNVVTIINGTSYPAAVDSTGKYFTTTFPGGVLISKGNSIDVYVQGDITGSGAASRTVDMDIDKVTDVYFIGQTYGYGIAPSGTYTPWYNSYITTINAGTATTISKANEVPSQNIAVNVANQPLGGFVTDFKGEAVSVTQVVVKAATSTAALGGLLTNVSVVDENGVVVAGPVDATWTSGNLPKQTITFSDTITFPTGRHIYTIKGKIPSGATDGAIVTLDTTPSGWTSPTGQTSGNSITISQANFSMNAMTVRAGALAISVSGSPASSTVVAGAQVVTLANIQFDASQSGEDVRFTSFVLDSDGDNGNFAASLANISTCQAYDGTTALNGGSNVVNPSTTATTTAGVDMTFTLDQSLTVAKGTVKTLAIKCNVSSGSDSSSTFQIGMGSTNIAAVAVTGVTSGGTITATGSGSNGQVMTVASSATVAATAAATSVAQPALSLVPAGTAGVTIGYAKFTTANEGATIQKIGLTLVNGNYPTNSTGASGSSNSGVGDVTTAYLYNGATLLGSVTFTGSSQTATSTLSTPLSIPNNGAVTVTIKADLAPIGVGETGGIGDLVKVDPLNAQGVGAQSGSQINISATAGVNGVKMHKSVPTVALGTGACAGNLCNGSNSVVKVFTVKADAAGSVSLYQFKLTVATSSASVTTLNVSVLDGSGNVSTSTFGNQQCIAGSLCASNPTLTISGGPVIIPAGQTYTFKITATVSPDATATNWSVVTTLVGTSSDASGVTVWNAKTAAQQAGGNFVWSDNATSTSGITTISWFSGFQVNGLPSVGI